MELRTAGMKTPIGEVRMALRGEALCAVVFEERWDDALARLRRRFGDVAVRAEADPGGVVRRFEAYFAGELGALDDVAVDPGGTPFQARVWAALRAVPAGTTMSYGALGEAIGAAPGASRAVGAANGANPVWLVIPCHRIIAAGGGLCGYAGGIERKRWLLAHEGAEAARHPFFSVASNAAFSASQRASSSPHVG
jgi:methylated-DNA-[protein]-cysteine S-methyltransferase